MEKGTTGRLFKNPLLESLTRSNPPTTILFYSLMIISFLFLNYTYTQNNVLQTVLLYSSGLFVWTLIEYILHRFIFHIDEYIPKLKRLHYLLHGIHHDFPRDHERLFMPPVPGTIIAAILSGFWYLFLGKNTFAFMAGISNGYLIYTYIHYSVHTKPVYQPMRKLWKNHALHHYKYPKKAFGVSSPLWDHIFRTMPPDRTKQDLN
ncbi:MAG: hypothetical protein K0S44_2274 [Bacteroidetes bacterium]|jgi:sterol desaturase/sphingolipid hydroxylase (fatty acid hydroxylase superfamily)|nr:hypothetical protein [Bacteroidota bacterium]